MYFSSDHNCRGSMNHCLFTLSSRRPNGCTIFVLRTAPTLSCGWTVFRVACQTRRKPAETQTNPNHDWMNRGHVCCPSRKERGLSAINALFISIVLNLLSKYFSVFVRKIRKRTKKKRTRRTTRCCLMSHSRSPPLPHQSNRALGVCMKACILQNVSCSSSTKSVPDLHLQEWRRGYSRHIWWTKVADTHLLIIIHFHYRLQSQDDSRGKRSWLMKDVPHLRFFSNLLHWGSTKYCDRLKASADQDCQRTFTECLQSRLPPWPLYSCFIK